MVHRFGFKTLTTLLTTVPPLVSVFAQAPGTAPPDPDRLLHLPESGRLAIEMGGLRAIRVTSDFQYAGGRRFHLTPSVDAEQHVFVDADSIGTVRRVIWIQVESRAPADSGTYHYPNDSARTVAGLPVTVSTRRYSTPPEPTSDRGSAFRIVEAAGFELPVDAIRVRLI